MTLTTTVSETQGCMEPPADIGLLGREIRLLATKESTAGAYTMVHYKLPARQMGAVPHYHKIMTESFYVLEGRLTMLQGDRWTDVEPGTSVTVLPGTVHGFRNDTHEPVVFLGFATPGGIEQLLYGVARLIREDGLWPPRDPHKLTNLGRVHDSYYV